MRIHRWDNGVTVEYNADPELVDLRAMTMHLKWATDLLADDENDLAFSVEGDGSFVRHGRVLARQRVTNDSTIWLYVGSGNDYEGCDGPFEEDPAASFSTFDEKQMQNNHEDIVWNQKPANPNFVPSKLLFSYEMLLGGKHKQ